MADVLVSIIVPSFNQGQFIRATLDSILQQSYRLIECIVIDGGSIDSTLDVLKNYNDERLHWISEPDNGQTDAINKGIHKAHGDLISYLNSDDLLIPEAVQFIVDRFINHSEVDVIYGDCLLIDETGKEIGISHSKPFQIGDLLTGKYPIRQPGTFWRANVSRKIGDLDINLHYTMDADYWLRMGLSGFNLEYVPGTRAAFRLHSHSKTVSLRSPFFSDWLMIMDKTYGSPILPAEIQALKPESYAFVEWGIAKTHWLEGDYAVARPLLRKFLFGRKWTRRMLAVPMLIDSYLHTPFTRWVDYLVGRLTGKEILFGERQTS